jgi:hypothetical protein
VRESHPYAGSDATFGTIVANGPWVLVGGTRSAAAGGGGVILVKDVDGPGWVEAELPLGMEQINDVALVPRS